MLITIGGPSGSGKSTLAKMLKDKLKLQYEYAGALFRKMAENMNMSVEAFGEYAAKHPEIDRELDTKMVGIAKKASNHLLEGRMIGALVCKANVPAFKIWLDASIEVRAQRLTVREHYSHAEAIEKIAQRDECDTNRYLDIYGIDPSKANCYDLTLASDKLSPEQLVEIIMGHLNINFKENLMTTESQTIISMDDLAVKVGGMFALVTLINKRTREIKQGAKPLVNESLKNVKEVVLKEIEQGKISLKAQDASEYEVIYEEGDEFFLED